MGGLSDKIDGFMSEWTPSQGPTCSIRVLIEALPDDDAASILRLVESKVYGTEVAKFLHEQILPEFTDDQAISTCLMRVKSDSVQRHRRGACGCRKGS